MTCTRGKEGEEQLVIGRKGPNGLSWWREERQEVERQRGIRLVVEEIRRREGAETRRETCYLLSRMGGNYGREMAAGGEERKMISRWKDTI